MTNPEASALRGSERGRALHEVARRAKSGDEKATVELLAGFDQLLWRKVYRAARVYPIILRHLDDVYEECRLFVLCSLKSTYDPDRAMPTTFFGRSVELYLIRLARKMSCGGVSVPDHHWGDANLRASPQFAAATRSAKRSRILIDDMHRSTGSDAEDYADANELAAKVRGMLDRLPERQAAVLEMRFGIGGGEPQTLEAIGLRFSLSRERVRQIQEAALRALRIGGERKRGQASATGTPAARARASDSSSM